jgi:hypothetical protein
MSSPEKPPTTAMPPAPPGELPSEEVARIRAISDALTQLGDGADARALAAHVKVHAGLDLNAEEVAALQRQLLEKAKTPEERGK